MGLLVLDAAVTVFTVLAVLLSASPDDAWGPTPDHRPGGLTSGMWLVLLLGLLTLLIAASAAGLLRARLPLACGAQVVAALLPARLALTGAVSEYHNTTGAAAVSPAGGSSVPAPRSG